MNWHGIKFCKNSISATVYKSMSTAVIYYSCLASGSVAYDVPQTFHGTYTASYVV